MQQMSAELDSAPTSMSEYEIGGRKYIVVSHYVGNKDFKKVFERYSTIWLSVRCLRICKIP